jgi:hypothetical protein
MTSIVSSVRQVASDGGYFVNVAAFGSAITNVFDEASTLAFAADPLTSATGGPGTIVSWDGAIAAAAAGTVVLKDMGKTIIAPYSVTGEGGPLLFRKVQLVNADATTFGVAGTPADGFRSGYVLIASESALGSGIPIAPLARYGL